VPDEAIDGGYDGILDLSVRAWGPVFPLMKREIPDYVYGAFYPDGWKTRQRSTLRLSAKTAKPACGLLWSTTWCPASSAIPSPATFASSECPSNGPVVLR